MLCVFFLLDLGSLPALAAVPVPWEISSGGSAGGCTLSPGGFGAMGTDVSPSGE